MCEVAVAKQEYKKPEKWLGVRHLQYCLLFSILNLAYGVRSVLSVGIYAMISPNPPHENIPTYPEWTSHKHLMLSSFFWGYICFQVGAGQLAKKYGPKWFMAGSACISSIFCALVPLFGSLFGYGGVIACRVVTGMTQGFIFPCVHNLISAWAPIQDRAKVASFVYTGGPLGSVIAMPITGFISDSSYGWPVVFYLYGGLGLCWFCIWLLIGYDTPAQHKAISREERTYIESGIETDENKEKMPTPWKCILTSMPFWAILVTHCGQNLGFWTLQTEIPSYMQNILRFEIASNSTLSSLPFLAMWLLSLIMSPIADSIVGRKISVGTSRKIFNSIGMFVPALSLISLSFVNSSQYVLAISLLIVAVGFNAAIYSGYNVNHIDLSPVHAGTLMGITNTVSNIFSLMAPLLVQAVADISGYEETDKPLWTIVFCIASCVYISVGVFYIFCASGDVQPWNKVAVNQENIKKRSEKIV